MGSRGTIATLLERFPALKRLGAAGGGSRVPTVRQTTATDCGAASLAMVLAYHGKQVKLDEVRQVLGIGRDGANALSILEAGR